MIRGLLLAFLLLSAEVWAQAGGLINGSRGFPVPNSPSGTTLNLLATINASGQALTATTSSTGVPAYIVVGGAGTTGTASLAIDGTISPCTMDATVASNASGYYVVASTTTGGQCHPQSAAPATGIWQVGYVLSSSTSSGSTALVLTNYDLISGGGTVGPGTPSFLPSFATSTTIGNSGLDEGVTNANGLTVSDTAGIFDAAETATGLSTANQFKFTGPIIFTSGVPPTNPYPSGPGAGVFAVGVDHSGYLCEGFGSTPCNEMFVSGANVTTTTTTFAPNATVGGSTSNFFFSGPASDTNTAPFLNVDTGASSTQPSFRAGIQGTSQLQICEQSGPQGETVFGSAVTCPNINTSPFAKVVMQTASSSGAHQILRFWGASTSQTADLFTINTATAAGTGFNFFSGYAGVTSTDTSKGGGTQQYQMRGDGQLTLNALAPEGTYLQINGTQDIKQNAWADEATTAGASYTVGDLACFTATNTVGNCPSGTGNLQAIGILLAKNGSIPVIASGGQAPVNSNASFQATAGDFICTDAANGALVVDGGTSACPNTEKLVGYAVGDASSGTSHVVDISIGDAGTSSSGGVASWNQITASTGNSTTANGNNNTTYNEKLTGSTDGFDFGETTASTGTGNIVGLSTLANSTASVLGVAQGNDTTAANPGTSVPNEESETTGNGGPASSGTNPPGHGGDKQLYLGTAGTASGTLGNNAQSMADRPGNFHIHQNGCDFPTNSSTIACFGIGPWKFGPTVLFSQDATPNSTHHYALPQVEWEGAMQVPTALLTVAVNNGGTSGFTVGDILVVNQSVGADSTPAAGAPSVQVTSVSSGVITGLQILLESASGCPTPNGTVTSSANCGGITLFPRAGANLVTANAVPLISSLCQSGSCVGSPTTNITAGAGKTHVVFVEALLPCGYSANGQGPTYNNTGSADDLCHIHYEAIVGQSYLPYYEHWGATGGGFDVNIQQGGGNFFAINGNFQFGAPQGNLNFQTYVTGTTLGTTMQLTQGGSSKLVMGCTTASCPSGAIQLVGKTSGSGTFQEDATGSNTGINNYFNMAGGNILTVSSSNFTTASASLVTITGLTQALPVANTSKVTFECNLLYSEATASTAVVFGVQTASNAPTNLAAGGRADVTSTTFTDSTPITGVSSTTAQNVISVTPTATAGTVLTVNLFGTVEGPSASGTTLNIMADIASGITLTVYRGSMCRLF